MTRALRTPHGRSRSRGRVRPTHDRRWGQIEGAVLRFIPERRGPKSGSARSFNCAPDRQGRVPYARRLIAGGEALFISPEGWVSSREKGA